MIFVDTSAWYASEVEDDVNHEQARNALAQIATGKHGIAITTDYVLDETLTLMKSRRGLTDALKFIGKIRKSQSVRVFWVNEGIFEKALSIFGKTGDKSWSFTDCTSFALMEDLSINEAFSFDSHFTEVGLRRLP
jgi:uncharacterized protein